MICNKDGQNGCTKGLGWNVNGQWCCSNHYSFVPAPKVQDPENPPAYLLSLTKYQAEIAIKALDLYSRIGMGQLEEIASIYRWEGRRMAHYGNADPDSTEINFDRLEDALNVAKRSIGHVPNGSHGIHSPNVPDFYRVAWDLQQVVRNRLAWDGKPEGDITVDFDHPRQSARHPLASISSLKA